MANEKYYPVQARKSDVIIRHGTATGAGANALTLPSSVWGQLITAGAHSSTGVYALTLDKKYQELKSFNVKIVNGTTAYLRGELTAIDVTAGTATLKTDVNGTLTDMGTSDVLYLELHVRNSGRNK